jgi:hypothetical protein
MDEVDQSTSESLPIQAVASPMHVRLHQGTYGLSQRCPPPPPGRRTTVDAIVRLMQVMLAPERISPLLLHTSQASLRS